MRIMDEQKKISFDLKKDTDQILTLMNIYLTEWCHRDELLWKQVFTYFYATLIVLFLPFLAKKIPEIELPSVSSVVFAVVALVMSVVFLIVSLGYAKRLAAIGDSYREVAKFMPTDMKYNKITDDEFSWNKKWEKQLKKLNRCNKLLDKRMSVLLTGLMFISLIILSVVMIFVYAG